MFSLNAFCSTREAVIKNLNNTIIPEITLDDFTIEELMKILHAKSGGKINFLYLKRPILKVPTTVQINPLTGLPITPPLIPLPPQNIEPELPRVKTVQVSLKNVTLQQLLDITVICFDQPMKYIIADFGIVFMHLKDGEKQLYSRKYKINPNIFRK